MFHSNLNERGLIVNEGKMVDASFTTAPRQRNTPDENKQIKESKGDKLWNDEPHPKSPLDKERRRYFVGRQKPLQSRFYE